MEKRATVVAQDLRGVWVIAIVMAIMLTTLIYEHRSLRGRAVGDQARLDEVVSE